MQKEQEVNVVSTEGENDKELHTLRNRVREREKERQKEKQRDGQRKRAREYTI